MNSDLAGASREQTSFASASGSDQGAAVAATRVWTAGILLGTLGLALSAFVVRRLLFTWRVTPHAASHHISLLGHRLSYPVANFDALVVLALAIAGLTVAAMTVFGAVRELLAAKSFARRLSAQELRPLNGALVIHDERPQAFCAGLFNPRVYVSSGAVALLDEPALNAVLAHEAHHARHRDPLRLAVGRGLARALSSCPASTSWFVASRTSRSSGRTRPR